MFTKAQRVTVHGGEFNYIEHHHYSDPIISKLHQASASGALYESQDYLPLPEGSLEAPTNTIQAVFKWFSSRESEPLLWLQGSSKPLNSAIAHAIVKKSKERGEFAASFFFNSRRPRCSSIKHFIPTIADQLIQFIPGFYTSLTRSLHGDPFILERPIPTQVERLILEPLCDVTAHSPFLIIVDALDDCADRHEILTQISHIVLAHQGLIRFVVLTSAAPPLAREGLFDELEVQSISHSLVVHVPKRSRNGVFREGNLISGKGGLGEEIILSQWLTKVFDTPFRQI